MNIPKMIVTDEDFDGPGALIYEAFIMTHPKTVDKIIEGFSANKSDFTILTVQQYEDKINGK